MAFFYFSFCFSFLIVHEIFVFFFGLCNNFFIFSRLLNFMFVLFPLLYNISTHHKKIKTLSRFILLRRSYSRVEFFLYLLSSWLIECWIEAETECLKFEACFVQLLQFLVQCSNNNCYIACWRGFFLFFFFFWSFKLYWIDGWCDSFSVAKSLMQKNCSHCRYLTWRLASSAANHFL